MTKIFKTNSKPNFLRVVIHTKVCVYSLICSDFGQALELFKQLGMVPEDITHVDISQDKIDAIRFDD